jgi:hypothetical protein
MVTAAQQPLQAKAQLRHPLAAMGVWLLPKAVSVCHYPAQLPRLLHRLLGCSTLGQLLMVALTTCRALGKACPCHTHPATLLWSGLG